MILDHSYCCLTVIGPLRSDADLLESVYCTFTELSVVIHHKHIPLRQNHICFLDLCFFQIQYNMKLCAFSQFTFYLYRAAHGIYNILGYGHSKTCTFCLTYTGAVLSGKWLKDFFPELRSHANAVVLYMKMYAHKFLSLRRFLLIHRHTDTASVRCKLYGIG